MKFVNNKTRDIMVNTQIVKSDIVKTITNGATKKQIEDHFTKLNKHQNDWAAKNIKGNKQLFTSIMKKANKQAMNKVINNLDTLKKIDTQGLKPPEISRLIAKVIDDKKLFTMTTAGGRQLSLDYYTRLVAQDLVMKEKNNAITDQAKAEGKDLVKVSSHSGSCSLCRQFEGKIFSLSGNDKKYPKLPNINPHPNCSHFITLL